MIIIIIPCGGIVNMKYKGYRKIFIIGMSIIFLCSGIISCSAQIQEDNTSNPVMEPTSNLSSGVHRYLFTKMGWNTTSTKLEIIDSVGIIGKLFHFGGISGSTFEISFGMKLKVMEGTLTLSPLVGPIVNLHPGDTFQFHLLLDNINNNEEDWISYSLFIVTVETS